jgi:hypothetical protein
MTTRSRSGLLPRKPSHKAQVRTAGSRDPRWFTALMLVVAGLAHVSLIRAHLEEAPYMGILFILFTVASVALAGMLLMKGSMIWYTAAGGLCFAALIAYAATRLIAFPQLSDDVGAWTESPGPLCVAAELAVVLSVALVIRGDLPPRIPVAAQHRRGTSPEHQNRASDSAVLVHRLHGSTSAALFYLEQAEKASNGLTARHVDARWRSFRQVSARPPRSGRPGPSTTLLLQQPND